ncbi:hypothetical protein C6P40_000948 [Pichia californica]|uniref:G-patch domain-containing protein n=1 Tax=Pichia californica TaxID=460514 RepID=A0A9P6WPF3_9ASCO|nr:hypothetical protein C6P42_002342 [[Candida] californica]KAG0690864.1 hypothetical protein C6P40_000948 [[Candida] californica]
MSDDILKTYGKGASLMMKMGYVPGTGLGENGRGIVEPIMPTVRKKGEGIKVDGKRQEMNMMQSVRVDDWSDIEENHSSSDDENTVELEKQIPLGFNKSGIYKSEYDIPEITELIRKLRNLNINVPYELMEWIDSMDSKSMDSPKYLQLRKTLWDILKQAQSDIPKVKFLRFEIKNMEEFELRCEKDIDVIKQIYEIFENCDSSNEMVKLSNNSIVNRILKIDGILETSNEIKIEIVALFASFLNEWWKNDVEKCNFQDINEFGEMLDIASKILNVSKLLGFTDVIMKNSIDLNRDRIINIEFSLLGSVILKPIVIKLGQFFEEWDVEKINVGTGVFVEVEESELFPSNIFRYLIFESMIIPRLKNYIDLEDLNSIKNDNDVRMFCIIEWMRICSKYSFESIEKKIINKYSDWILKINKYMEVDELLQLLLDSGIQFWLDVFMKDEYKSQIEKVLLAVQVIQFRNNGEFNKHKVIQFLERIKYLGMVNYSSVIENEICIPILEKFKYIDEERPHTVEKYLREWVIVFSQNGIFDSEELGYNCIISSINICYKMSSTRIVGYKGPPIEVLEDSLYEIIKSKESNFKTLVLNSVKVKDTDRYVYWEKLCDLRSNNRRLSE